MPQNYILLERIELASAAASVVFNNIPQTGYTDLKIVMSARSNYASTFDNIQVRFNGITTGYSSRALYGSGSSALSTSLSLLYAGDIPAVNATSSTFSNQELYIPNYTSSTHKSVSMDSVAENNATATWQFLTAGLWSNTAAITSIELFSGNSQSLIAGSTFSLYGLAATGTTPVIAPKATGGNLIENDGTYWIHTFTSTGTFTPLTGLTCDALVVAGGGGGASNVGGGGGAGGYRTSTGLSVAAQVYTITVGAGGAAGQYVSGLQDGFKGSNSSFSTITATGGGLGDGNGGGGGVGGSGGGGDRSSTGGAGNQGGYSPSEGNNGGTGFGGGGGAAAGGGGAGSVGSNGAAFNGGNGGTGVASSITGTSVSRAGGGGGSAWAFGSGTGGVGVAGGGNGQNQAGGGVTSGTANTGGGGGGALDTTAGTGGSGIVVIRYPIA